MCPKNEPRGMVLFVNIRIIACLLLMNALIQTNKIMIPFTFIKFLKKRPRRNDSTTRQSGSRS
jgi:hypothetical protein